MNKTISQHTAKEAFANRPASDRRQPVTPIYRHDNSRTQPIERQTKPSPTPQAEHKRAEYRIIEGPNGIAELEMKVNDMLDQGWKLMGGVSFDRGCAYQAMARITKDPMEPSVPPPTLT